MNTKKIMTYSWREDTQELKVGMTDGSIFKYSLPRIISKLDDLEILINSTNKLMNEIYEFGNPVSQEYIEEVEIVLERLKNS